MPLVDTFYGSINPTFDTVGDNYLVFVTNLNYRAVFTNTNPGNYSAADFSANQLFVGNGVTQYFQFDSPGSGSFFSYSLIAYITPEDPTDFQSGSFPYAYGQQTPGFLTTNFSLGDPIVGQLVLNQNVAFAPADAPEIDPSGGTVPLLMLLGGVASGHRRRRHREIDAAVA
ncbi:MAG: hypothetical protein J0I12_01525 [Candidatus Eremiobacteraeota bacterium]|nr:hypothetical protein [Candidatus Eremiobacteraeota bacterium]